MPILQGRWRTERRFLACDWKRQTEAAAVFANDYCGEAPTPRLTCSMRRSGYFGHGWMKPSAIFSRGRTVRAQRSDKPSISQQPYSYLLRRQPPKATDQSIQSFAATLRVTENFQSRAIAQEVLRRKWWERF
jgi:hypothetical protein